MNEFDIAINCVKPYLSNVLGFPEENIKGYGRVPIQIGSSVIWADFVCYSYNRYNQGRAYCIIEVKDCSDGEVDFAIPQAESYAQRLNAPFFCTTNGKAYKWYMTGMSQGDYIQLSDKPPLPDSKYLKKPDKAYISPYLFEAINNYEAHLVNEKNSNVRDGMYDDTKWHHESTASLNHTLWDDNKLKNKTVIIDELTHNTMKSRGKTQLLREIKTEYDRFLELVKRLKDSTISIEERIETCTGGNSQYGIAYGALFFITQILAGLYPNEFTVIQYNATKAMQRFQLTDINFKVETVKDYLYFNQICLELYEHFKNPFQYNLSYVHNFLWHYENEYIVNGHW